MGGISDEACRVLTRDLLVRASRARNGESQALRFRALHLNLPVVAAVSDRLGLSDAERRRTEHAALDGLHEAVRLFDPYGETGFAEFAASFVEGQIRAVLCAGVPRPAHATSWTTISPRTAPASRR